MKFLHQIFNYYSEFSTLIVQKDFIFLISFINFVKFYKNVEFPLFYNQTFPRGTEHLFKHIML